ncbi:Receptor kinase [Chlorella sorokiniana]|uniref:Receptor kinase n=1 Tax=Chlorella sorokiniana TaxID=3076 RepID=A0A2P6U0K2_CHLSO|nr:Receptor kinase [Chlorella sorokiniana]|eukprot:PRW59839.1 Receptor kinase [Chlorella sorokiniana]
MLARRQLPPSLATATCLRRLEVSFSYKEWLGREVPDLLRQLPALKQVSLAHCDAQPDVAGELAALPNVTVSLAQAPDYSLQRHFF